jgi:hypothetical protein
MYIHIYVYTYVYKIYEYSCIYVYMYMNISLGFPLEPSSLLEEEGDGVTSSEDGEPVGMSYV